MKPVIFDLDGTLIDSAPDLHAAANKVLATFDARALPMELVVSFIGNGVHKLVERCLLASKLPVTSDAVEMFMAFYEADSFTLTRPYEGILECLQTLHYRGMKIGVCTNKPVGPARTILDGLKMLPYFDAVIGGDSCSTMKPDPAPLLLCAEELGGIDPIYVGDSETDAATATNADVTFALFSGGYRKSPTDNIDYDFLFEDFTKLTEFAIKS
ncbi:MAG: phosphoglycolate phosphatase [Blastopirellula sp.]|nr:MAG: phosphoglycolate phosphatase [Blastopirellula sp.]